MRPKKQRYKIDELSHIDWDKLKIIYEISRSRTLSEAAIRLKIDQSSLTRILHKFEKTLGFSILSGNRTLEGIELTEEAQVLLTAAQNIRSELSTAGREIDEHRNSPIGLLKISPVLGFFHRISSYIPEFMKLYPDMRLIFYETDLPPQLERLEADVLIRPYLKDRPDLIQDLLVTFHLGMYASPKYLKKHGVPKTIEDLDKHQLIASSLARFTHQVINSNWILSLGKKPGQNRVPFIESNSSVTRMEFAKSHLGIVSLPKEEPNLKKSGLVSVLPDIEGPSLKLYYTYFEADRQAKRLEAFRDFLMSIFGQNKT